MRKEVRVSPDQVSDEFVRMVPSPDMAAAYEAKATRFRVLAWVATGVGVAGLGGFITGNLLASSKYGDAQTVNSFAWYRAQLVAGDETAGNREKAGQLRAEIETLQTVSWIGLAAAGAGAIAATVLFVIGDPPGRYEAYRQKTGVVSMTLSPTPGGVVLTGAF